MKKVKVIPTREARSRLFYSPDRSRVYLSVTDREGDQYRTYVAARRGNKKNWVVADSFLSLSQVVETVMIDNNRLWMFAIDNGELVIRDNYIGKQNDVTEIARIPLSSCLLDRAHADDVEIGLVRSVEDGLLVTYVHQDSDSSRSVYGLLVGRDNPGYVVWHDHIAMGRTDVDRDSVLTGGSINGEHIIHLWWDNHAQEMVEVVMDNPFSANRRAHRAPSLHKFEGNPIIKPIPGSGWESLATYNPTAFMDGDDIHILYRAQGDSWESTLGWASSRDGLHIDYRHPVPIYHRRHPEEGADQEYSEMDFNRFRGLPMVGSDGSGGASWGSGGVEDCRVAVMDGRLYNLYAAFSGYKDTCVAMSSIDLQDFREQRFDQWTWPQLLTQPARFGGDGTKAGILFPERIRDKYVVMFRYFPSIYFDFVDNLDFSADAKTLQKQAVIGPSSRGWDVFRGGMGSGAPHHWDAYKVGAGGAPVKTEQGWLLIYQGFGINGDFGRYRAGAMLLDLDDPSRVIARSRLPILDATEDYEKNGLKPNVIYPCGTVVKDGTLYIYYGACDETTCVATASLDQFVDELIGASDAVVSHRRYQLYP